ncbi:MAG: LamG-like jellyroll fold domain-containing protein [Thermoplasmatota archaeon]
MRRDTLLLDGYAVSEVVGAVILLLIAVIVFATIVMYVFPLPIPPPEPNVKLYGYVNDNGVAVIEHMGGEPLEYYRIVVREIDGTLISTTTYNNEKEPWKIGECKYPNTGSLLLTENDKVRVSIYSTSKDGSEHHVFEGILIGKHRETPPLISPMLISSLRTNTVDEDLICYNYTIKPVIPASTYIYSWLVNGKSITDLLMPFDTNSLVNVKDYSGNGNNGTAYGPIWTNKGVVGGAYQFDGIDDYISIPYCFDAPFIDDLTVEGWINTSAQNGIISSYNRNKYWELGVTNGKVKWSTTAGDGTKDSIGISNVSDGRWHYVAATYKSFTGESIIYVDGKQDIKNNDHTQGELIGTGESPNGWIGTGPEAARETIFYTSFETEDEKNNWKPDNETGGGGASITWETVFYDNFETGWGNWNDGGSDCSRYTGGTYAYRGSCAINIQDNSGYPNSATYSNVIPVGTQKYTQIKIDFWWIAVSMENKEDFWVDYYDGTTSHRLKTIEIGTGQYSNNVFYHTVCYVNKTDYPFTDQARFRIQCDASDDTDDVYLDHIYINATSGYRVDYVFDLFDADELNPRTGTYSIGGSGDFDPDYAYYNRTGIDISGYKDVTLSVWYSYDSTEADDYFGLYYKDGTNWVTIFEVDPQIGNGNQLEWTNVQVQIPDHIYNLVLQFKWSTSSTSEYVAIDDLEITGILLGGGYNFSGAIDEFRIYNRVLSSEQIYQNYLCAKYGRTDKSVIVSEETYINDIWRCIVTPNDGINDDTPVESNILQIISYGGGG